MLHSKNIQITKLTISMKRLQELFFLTKHHPLSAFLTKTIFFSIHKRNIQSLATEIYRFLNRLCIGFLNIVFNENWSNPYALQNCRELYSINLKIFRYGTETGSYIASEIWSKLPETIKMSSSLQTRMCLPNIFVSLIILHFLTLPYILSFVTYVFFNFL